MCIRKQVWASRLGSIVGIAVAICLGGGPVNAQDREAAREAFRDGIEQFEAAQFEQASMSFRLAYELSPSWKLLYNIGQCDVATKRYGLALEALEAYLAEGGDEVPKGRQHEVANEIARLLTMVGNLEVDVARDGITVIVDGYVRGHTPIVGGIRVTGGVVHRVSLEWDDTQLMSSELIVDNGKVYTLALKVGADEGALGDSANTIGKPLLSGRSQHDEGVNPWIFWGALGITGAFGITSIGLDVAIGKKVDEIENDRDNDGLRDSAKGMQKANYVVIGLTGAMAIATLFLFLKTDFDDDMADNDSIITTSFLPLVNDNGAGLTLAGSF